jgi:hypothetical protein
MKRIASAKGFPGTHRYQSGSRSRALWRRLVLFSWLSLAVLALVFLTPRLAAQQAKPSEYAVKAAYLYNFARFVEWPAGVAAASKDSFIICVLGQDPFGPALDATLAGEKIDGKPVVAKRISKPQDSVGCRILFISPSEDARLKDILATVDKSGLLTVSDMAQFSRRGGMIQLVLDGSKVRFEVNVTNARAAGLTLSSELLKVAIAVRENNQSGN